MILLVLFVIGSYYDLVGDPITHGAVGFMTVYIVCLLIRNASAKRELRDKNLLK